MKQQYLTTFSHYHYIVSPFSRGWRHLSERMEKKQEKCVKYIQNILRFLIINNKNKPSEKQSAIPNPL